MSLFAKAVKAEAKLRLAIAGPSGSGKTYSALSIAQHLTDKPVALVDTEHGSASKYADLFTFDVLQLDPPYHPDRFLEAISDATKAGYGVIILDSLSHAWMGTGGLLDLVDEIAKKNRNPNTFAAWKDATPIQNRLVDGIIASDIHIIATMRSKQEYILQENDKGRQVPKKVGLAPVQRDSFEYEFDIFLEMDNDNNAHVGKTRCAALNGKVINQPGKQLAETLKAWLTGVHIEKKAPVTRPSQSQPSGNPPAMTLETAKKEKSAEGVLYWDTPTNELQNKTIGIKKMLAKHDLPSEKRSEYQRKLDAINTIVQHKRDAELATSLDEPNQVIFHGAGYADDVEAGLDPRDGMPFGDK